MKISCEIIKDLLPLYLDGVCSNDSKVMVEEHLAECDSCKAELHAMKGEFFFKPQRTKFERSRSSKKNCQGGGKKE